MEKNRLLMIFQWKTSAREESIEGKTFEHWRKKYLRYCDIDEEKETPHLLYVKKNMINKNHK